MVDKRCGNCLRRYVCRRRDEVEYCIMQQTAGGWIQGAELALKIECLLAEHCVDYSNDAPG